MSETYAAATADARAAERMLAVDPCWRGLELARTVLDRPGRLLLHAGPPLERRSDLPLPLLNSAVMAVLFEGWASSEDEAEALVQSSAIELQPAQDHHVVVPLADVLSPSMWLQRVEDRNDTARVAWSPINGGAGPVMRVGQRNDAVVTHLRFINGDFAQALRSGGEFDVRLLELADEGLALGDDCHGRTSHATAALARRLAGRWGADRAGDKARAFLDASPSFFLNLWMAATKCMMRAAEGVEGAAVVTAAGGNGAQFGIRLAHSPRTWLTANARPPLIAGDADPTRNLGAIGDSAVVDLFGLGAMTTRREADAAPPYSQVFPDAMDLSRRLLMCEHPQLARSCARVALSARAVVTQREAPVVSLGVLDKRGVEGRLGGGFYRPPLALFEQGCAMLSG
jgi:hypothetical protein